MKFDYKKSEDHYKKYYSTSGSNNLRQYPNEELCRFMGREFFKYNRNERSKIKILELGFGCCTNLWMIAKEGFQAYGIDFSEDAINLSKNILNKHKVEVDIKTGNICELPYNENEFDAVIDVFTSYCLIEKDFLRALDEIYRVLKIGGKFFSYTPSTNSDAFLNHMSKKIDDYTLDGIKRKTSPFYGNDYPFRFISPERYVELLNNFNFEVTYLETLTRTYNKLKENFQFVIIVGKKK
ncbi:MAG: class I SAM-dependent methyltransferase [Promethearchaeota archaeon]